MLLANTTGPGLGLRVLGKKVFREHGAYGSGFLWLFEIFGLRARGISDTVWAFGGRVQAVCFCLYLWRCWRLKSLGEVAFGASVW